MNRREFLKSAFIFTGAIWVPKFGIQRVLAMPPGMVGSSGEGPSGIDGTYLTEDFESWVPSGWTEVDTGNKAAQSSSHGVQTGTYSAEFDYDDTTAEYLYQAFSNAITEYWVRWYMEIPSKVSTSGDVSIVYFELDGNTTYSMYVKLSWSGNDYQVTARALTDTGIDATSPYTVGTVGDGRHYVEIHWKQATGAGQDDGELELWIDGALQESLTTIDNDTRIQQEIHIGIAGSLDAGNDYPLYIDTLDVHDSYLGPKG